MSKNILVSYFSASGVTKKLAQNMAEAADCDIFEIEPEVPYTSADLNWMDKKSRSSVEMANKSFRPAIASKIDDISKYDVVFVGFPIWWYVAPTIINTFLESYDFSGKTVVLFATSGGSGFGKAVAELKPSVSDTTVIKEGKLMNGKYSSDQLKAFIEGFSL